MLRFGAFELDPIRGELRRNGMPIRLQHQPLTALVVLASRAGEVVTREELRRAIWPDGTFVDFDRGLNFCINRVRRTLDEDARDPRYIETVPRAGYRFIAPVTSIPPADAPRVVTTAFAGSPRRTRALVASALVALLAVRGDAGSRGGQPSADVPHGPAGDVYARGLYEERSTGGGNASLRSFEEALRLDPASAAVAASLAQAWVHAVQEGRVSPREGMPKARTAAARAVALGDLPAGHLVLGTVALRHDWDWPAAERSLRRALDLDPSLAAAHLEMADLLLVRGRPGEALREAERAEQIDPVCPVVRGQVAASYYAARRFADAADAWRRSALVAPALVGPHERLFHAYRHASRARDAVGEAVQVLSILGVPGAAPLLSRPPGEAMAAFVSGTIEYLERDALLAPASVADRIAVLHAILGHRSEALRWLAVAVRERSTTLPVTLATDPDLDGLRSDPAFRALLDQLTLS
jgi:DNA-binding winged helix-turn-helix (wHTH) protein/tetratricopeptide (TPR) repeat protein